MSFDLPKLSVSNSDRTRELSGFFSYKYGPIGVMAELPSQHIAIVMIETSSIIPI